MPTLAIYDESRISKPNLNLNQTQRPTMRCGFNEITQGEEFSRKEQIIIKCAILEALAVDPKDFAPVASDIAAY